LRDQLALGNLRVPTTAERWLALQVSASPGQAVKSGDLIAVLAPLDTRTQQPAGLVAHLDVEEKYCADLTPGQMVRLSSNMYNPRLHSTIEARIERIEPWGEPHPRAGRQFRIVAVIDQAPFPVWIGSTVKAEIVVGRTPVYRIILEQ
jgi:hypothetical protein